MRYQRNATPIYIEDEAQHVDFLEILQMRPLPLKESVHDGALELLMTVAESDEAARSGLAPPIEGGVAGVRGGGGGEKQRGAVESSHARGEGIHARRRERLLLLSAVPATIGQLGRTLGHAKNRRESVCWRPLFPLRAAT